MGSLCRQALKNDISQFQLERLILRYVFYFRFVVDHQADLYPQISGSIRICEVHNEGIERKNGALLKHRGDPFLFRLFAPVNVSALSLAIEGPCDQYKRHDSRRRRSTAKPIRQSTLSCRVTIRLWQTVALLVLQLDLPARSSLLCFRVQRGMHALCRSAGSKSEGLSD